MDSTRSPACSRSRGLANGHRAMRRQRLRLRSACYRSHCRDRRPALLYGSSFLAYFYARAVQHVRSLTLGASDARSALNLEHVEAIVTPRRLEEQEAIAAHVDTDDSRIERSVVEPPDARSRCSREYRTRLIADVVTGKLDVREAAARLPDEVDEPEPLDELDVERARRAGRRRPGGGRGMTTDTSEARPRRPDRPRDDRAHRPALARARRDRDLRSRRRRHRLAARRSAPLRPRLLRRPRPAARLRPGDAGGPRRRAVARHGRADAAELPRPAAGRDLEARHDRRPPQRRQARAAPRRPLLRHAVAGQREGGRAVRAQPLQRHAAAPLQPRRDAARARPLPLHQRPAGRDVRAEEQPHQADGRGRRRAVQARPRPAREAASSSAAASPTSPSTTPRSASARSSRARRRGSCRSTGAGTTAPATRPTRTGSRPTTSGSRS